MPAPFAAATTRLNQAVFANLSDAEALFDGVAVQGMLDAGYEEESLKRTGPGGTMPLFMLPTASVPALPEGKPFVVTSGPAAGNYRVGNALPDGTGVTTLHLIPT